MARGWNSEFYRLQNKIYIDWEKVDQEIESFTQTRDENVEKIK